MLGVVEITRVFLHDCALQQHAGHGVNSQLRLCDVEGCRVTLHVDCRTICVGVGMRGGYSTSGTCPSQRGRPSWSVWPQVRQTASALQVVCLYRVLSCLAGWIT